MKTDNQSEKQLTETFREWYDLSPLLFVMYMKTRIK
jgi:hypothetical protein